VGRFFTLQKIIFRIMAGAQPRSSCSSIFKQLGILPLPFQYRLSLMSFIISNQKILQTNSSIHNIKTRNKHHRQRPIASLSCFQNSTFYAGKYFQQFTTQCDNPQEWQGKIYISLKKIPTYTFLLLCRWIYVLCVTVIYKNVHVKCL
jgi:hypothetical protein